LQIRRCAFDDWSIPECPRIRWLHRHPEDRIYTVISGVFYIGLGEEIDENKPTAHSPGSVLILPRGQPHFHWAKSGEYITQVSAIGPLGLTYLDPGDDPRTVV
jgi:uncharacterized RmlC-like cupin family protein